MNSAMEEMAKRARTDAAFRQKLLDTRSQKDPLAAFCRCAQGEGYGLTTGTLFPMGKSTAAQLKSTNGGGVTPYAYFDRPLREFFVELRYYQKNQPPEKKE